MIRDIGQDTQKEYLSRLGLFNSVNIDIPEKAVPIVPEPWRMVNTESISYGYGLSISPLHLAIATSSVINGGYLINPTLIKTSSETIHIEKVFSDRTSEVMRYLLSRVVDEGTAKDAFGKNADRAYTICLLYTSPSPRD